WRSFNALHLGYVQYALGAGELVSIITTTIELMCRRIITAQLQLRHKCSRPATAAANGAAIAEAAWAGCSAVSFWSCCGVVCGVVCGGGSFSSRCEDVRGVVTLARCTCALSRACTPEELASYACAAP